MSPSKHQETISKATQLFDNGYSPNYIYEKLVKDGIGADEAKATVESLTKKPFSVPQATEEGAAPALVESTEAANGGPTLSHYLIAGLLVIGIGLAATFGLPEMRWLGYTVLLAGPVIILFGAFRGRS